MATDFIIVFVTTKDKAEAEKIAQTLLREKLIACANIISPIDSRFHWEGKIDSAEECLAIMKTHKSLFWVRNASKFCIAMMCRGFGIAYR